MPIQTYQQRTDASGTISAGADASAFGAQTAQAGMRIGSALGDIGSAEMFLQRQNERLLKEQEEKDARSWAGTSVSQASLDWTENLTKRKESALPGAPDFTPSVLADFDSYASKMKENAPTPLAREFVTQHLTQMRTSIGEHALGFEAQARVGLRVDNAQTTIDNAGKTVLQDPSQYGTQLALIRQTMPEVGPDLTKKLNDKAIATLTEAAAAHAMDADPYAVQEQTSKALGDKGFTGKTGVPWVDDATPAQVKSWNSTASTKIHMIESEMARNAEAKSRVAESMFGAATDLTFKGQFMSEPYKAALLSATKGTQWESATTELINSQAVTAGFASAPAGDRNAVLNQMRTDGSTPGTGTDPARAKQLEKIEAIHSEIGKAVEQNPWVAAQKYGVTPDASSMPIADVNSALKVIQTRAQKQNQIETWAGHAISPLQPDEAAQLSDVLGKMNPPARSQALAQIGQSLPLGRITALADQLDKSDKAQALALKLGSDQTNAGRQVSELVLTGAQAIKDKAIKRDDSTMTGWRATIAEKVRGTLGDARAEQDVIDSAYYVRAAMDLKGINAPGFHLGSDEEDAIKLVIGQPMDRGGVKTLLPKGMSENQFDDAMKVYTADVFKGLAPDGNLYVRGQPVSPARVANSLTNYGMRRDGKGNYLPVSGGAFITVDKEGQRPLRLPVIR